MCPNTPEDLEMSGIWVNSRFSLLTAVTADKESCRKLFFFLQNINVLAKNALKLKSI